MCLSMNQIPFRYECPLELDNTTIYPDFTIRHPRTGETFYWEHFGMMDVKSYAQKAFAKLNLYTSHHIYPSLHLLTTCEIKDQPLDSGIVENMIRYYFLSS